MPRLWIGSLLLALAGPGAAVTVTIDQPGYFVIDGRYHVFDRPGQDGMTPIELHPRGDNGFYLRAYLAANDCQHPSGLLEEANLTSLRYGELLDQLDADRFDLRIVGGGAATLTIAACDGSLVVLADTPNGDTVCAGAVPFPFRRGHCKGLDRADRGHVFFDAFENP